MALKALSDDMASSPEPLERLRREARALAALGLPAFHQLPAAEGQPALGRDRQDTEPAGGHLVSGQREERGGVFGSRD
ncbi:MAG TPA: hypothetical protein VLK65_25460 [Vicinamibacteria bacterium]|nr:hypothetical protein [Vicinamibacteria bacterium]